MTFERAAAAELGAVADRSDGNAAGAALILLLQVLRRHHLKHTHLLMKHLKLCSAKQEEEKRGRDFHAAGGTFLRINKTRIS